MESNAKQMKTIDKARQIFGRAKFNSQSGKLEIDNEAEKSLNIIYDQLIAERDEFENDFRRFFGTLRFMDDETRSLTIVIIQKKYGFQSTSESQFITDFFIMRSKCLQYPEEVKWMLNWSSEIKRE